MDAERIHIGSRIGIDLPKFHEVMNTYYDFSYTTLYDFYKKFPVHNARTFCPDSISHRYVSEDVPYSLVPWYSLGRASGYTATAIKTIIDMTSVMNNVDYYKKGRILLEDHIKEFEVCG